MRRRRSAAPPRKTGRRWHIPPPLVHGPEALEGSAVLEEQPGALGVLLWQSLRDVMLWAQTPDAERSGLFAPGAEMRRRAELDAVDLDPRVQRALRTVTDMVEQPGSTAADRLSRAARQVSDWADERARPATALAFAQAAALARPDDAQAAIHVGSVARHRGDHTRAEAWYRRTVGLARQARDWRTYSDAFRGLGDLYLLRRNLSGARRLYVRALRGARRGGLRIHQARALHALALAEFEGGRDQELWRYARRAFETYGRRSRNLPAFARDLGRVWMEQGARSRAAEVFQALAPLLPERHDQRFLDAAMARMAAEQGSKTAYDETWSSLRHAAERAPDEPGLAEALTQLSHGAAALGDWGRAREAAEAAMQIARRRGGAEAQSAAQRALERVQQRNGARPPATDEQVELGRPLAVELVEVLRTGKFTGR